MSFDPIQRGKVFMCWVSLRFPAQLCSAGLCKQCQYLVLSYFSMGGKEEEGVTRVPGGQMPLRGHQHKDGEAP